MIEFKSDCGHTIRVKDEDAGKKVRCSYCGNEAEVPSSDAEDIDFLFADLGEDALASSKKRTKMAAPFSVGRRRDFNPFDIALKLVYATILIVVVVVVFKKVVQPYYTDAMDIDDEWVDDVADQTPTRGARSASLPDSDGGLIGLSGRGGLYIASFPSGATAYYVDSDAVRPGQRVSEAKNCVRGYTDAQINVSSGVFTVEVVLPWNAPSLTRYPGYTALRRRLENAASRTEKDQIVTDYFLPDGAGRVFVSQTEDQIYVVRQFHGVVTRSDRWTAIHALFIPADLGAEEAIQRFIPAKTNYTFDEEHVRGELDYYNVPAADRMFVLEALKRIGVMPYVTEDPTTRVRRTRLFKIGIEDGMFAAPVLSEVRP